MKRSGMAVPLNSIVRRFDFTPRKPGRSFAARGGLKDWPDEWTCATCSNSKRGKPGAKKVWCWQWRMQMSATSDRACFEETCEMKREREAYEKANKSDELRADAGPQKSESRKP